ncbi:MAG: hypothetical protein KIT00_06960 [Rhodospirillales bacterium]|nr:hypothetical protein [Rhodospirillales bacterium]
MFQDQQAMANCLEALISQPDGSLEIDDNIAPPFPGNGPSFPKNGKQRETSRCTTPEIQIILDGQPYGSTNWSMGGMVVENYTGRRATGALFTIDKIRSKEGVMTSVRICSRVIRNDVQNRRLVVSLLHMDERAHELLNHFMEERVRRLRKLRSTESAPVHQVHDEQESAAAV